MIKGQHPSVSSSQQSSNSSRRQHKAKPSKRVIAVDLPSNLQTIESVTTIFYPYGEVLLVRVLRPKKQLPFDLKQFQVELLSQNIFLSFFSGRDSRSRKDRLRYHRVWTSWHRSLRCSSTQDAHQSLWLPPCPSWSRSKYHFSILRKSVLLLKTCQILTGDFDISLFSASEIRLMEAWRTTSSPL